MPLHCKAPLMVTTSSACDEDAIAVHRSAPIDRTWIGLRITTFRSPHPVLLAGWQSVDLAVVIWRSLRDRRANETNSRSARRRLAALSPDLALYLPYHWRRVVCVLGASMRALAIFRRRHVSCKAEALEDR